MDASLPTVAELAEAIESATRAALERLFAEHPGHYYYLSLITTGEAHAPVVAAWSEEALEAAVQKAPDKEDARWALKWSYADSPFYCFGVEYFQHVNNLFAKLPDIHSLDASGYQREYEMRLHAMELAISNLDLKGFFGVGSARSKLIVNVEVMPPDHTNTQRAVRLNPPNAIRTWLEEAAELDSDP